MTSRHCIIAIGLAFSLSCATYAEDKNVTVVRVTPTLDLDQIQYVLSHSRDEVFERGMLLEGKQWEQFWGVYDEYEKDRHVLDAKRLRLLGTFIGKHAMLTNEEATKLIEASGNNQREELALRQKYFEVLSKKLNPVAAARFVQLDDMIGMVIRLAILGNVPLISGASEVPSTSPQMGKQAPDSSEPSPSGVPRP